MTETKMGCNSTGVSAKQDHWSIYSPSGLSQKDCSNHTGIFADITYTEFKTVTETRQKATTLKKSSTLN